MFWNQDVKLRNLVWETELWTPQTTASQPWSPDRRGEIQINFYLHFSLIVTTYYKFKNTDITFRWKKWTLFWFVNHHCGIADVDFSPWSLSRQLLYCLFRDCICEWGFWGLGSSKYGVNHEEDDSNVKKWGVSITETEIRPWEICSWQSKLQGTHERSGLSSYKAVVHQATSFPCT